MPERCQQFCEEKAHAIAQDPPLRKCLVEHLILLWKLALIRPSNLDSCLQIVDRAAPQTQQNAEPAEPQPQRNAEPIIQDSEEIIVID